jgi:hydrogenase nickel incorporation protein HypB
MIINKLDLLPYCDFSLEKVSSNALGINGQLDLLTLSCRTGDGLQGWFDWLTRRLEAKRR